MRAYSSNSQEAAESDWRISLIGAGQDRCIIPIKREHLDAWLNPCAGLCVLYAFLDDRERPYYEYRMVAWVETLVVVERRRRYATLCGEKYGRLFANKPTDAAVRADVILNEPFL